MISGDNSNIRNFIYDVKSGKVEEIIKPGDKPEHSKREWDPESIIIEIPSVDCEEEKEYDAVDVNFEIVTYNSKGKLTNNKKITNHIKTV